MPREYKKTERVDAVYDLLTEDGKLPQSHYHEIVNLGDEFWSLFPQPEEDERNILKERYRKQLARLVFKVAAAQLKEEQWRVFMAHLVEQVRHADIAERLNISIDQSETYYNSAIERLRRIFKSMSYADIVWLIEVPKQRITFKEEGDLPQGVKKQGKRFVARYTVNGKKLHIGTYDTPEEASNAYKMAYKLLKEKK